VRGLTRLVFFVSKQKDVSEHSLEGEVSSLFKNNGASALTKDFGFGAVVTFHRSASPVNETNYASHC
jgi:hypothetical protein